MGFVNSKGVDISYANGNIDLSKVKNAGYQWVMIRCGYGSDIPSQDDTQFAANVAKAEKLGMPWGVYLFSYACSTADAKSELAHIDRLLKEQRAKGYYPTVPIALDIEPSSYVQNKGAWTKANLTNVATIILDGLAKLGYYPMIYTGYDELDNMLSDHIRNDFDCWFAQWNSKPNAYKYNRLGIWQYGGETNYIESNSINGVGVIDKNYVYKDYPSIIKNGGYNGFKKSNTVPAANTTQKTEDKVTAEKILSIARAEIGTKATAVKKCKYNTAFYGYEVSASWADWCAAFIWWIFKQAGAEDLLFVKTAGCGVLGNAFYTRNKFKTSGFKPGDVVFFHWSNDRSESVPITYSLDHVGIIEKVNSDGTVTTIEGNTGSSAYGEVMRRTRSLSVISGVGRPDYGSATSKKTDSGKATVVKPDMVYRVRTKKRGWLPTVKNLEDYAGIENEPITGVAIKATKGNVWYQVHIKGGKWLGKVTGYDTNDYENGYAGLDNGAEIDAIRVYYTTPNDIRNAGTVYEAKYRVSPVGSSSYYDYQYDTIVSKSMDGYAGLFGKSIDKLQIILD